MKGSADLRDLAQHALDTSGDPVPAAALRRATLEIDVDGRTEVVMVSIHDGELRAVASDGATDGPHVMAALDLVARGRVSVPGTLAGEKASSPGTERPPPRVANPLADGLEELLTAIVRAGVAGAPQAPAVREAMEHVVREAPRPTPPGLGRALARLRRALGEGDLDGVARVLDGGARLALDLREEIPTAESSRRIAAWTTRAAARSAIAETLSERELVEVGREWLPSAGNGSLQRRYLVCTTTGEVFREERIRSTEASVGPCPRTLRVGLAHVEEGPAPRRVGLLQYEVAPELSDEAHDRLVEMADREVNRVVERYRQSVRQYPALAEPVVILRAEGRLRGEDGTFRFEDDSGDTLGLRAAAGVPAFLDAAGRAERARWLAGRLTESEGSVVLEPISLGLAGDPKPSVVRL